MVKVFVKSHIRVKNNGNGKVIVKISSKGKYKDVPKSNFETKCNSKLKVQVIVLAKSKVVKAFEIIRTKPNPYYSQFESSQGQIKA